ncbi:hypothetical protein ACNQFZ_07245 [Schinkia sp. CFF1]
MKRSKDIRESHNGVTSNSLNNKRTETEIEHQSKQVEYINIYWDEWKM